MLFLIHDCGNKCLKCYTFAPRLDNVFEVKTQTEGEKIRFEKNVSVDKWFVFEI